MLQKSSLKTGEQPSPPVATGTSPTGEAGKLPPKQCLYSCLSRGRGGVATPERVDLNSVYYINAKKAVRFQTALKISLIIVDYVLCAIMLNLILSAISAINSEFVGFPLEYCTV